MQNSEKLNTLPLTRIVSMPVDQFVIMAQDLHLVELNTLKMDLNYWFTDITHKKDMLMKLKETPEVIKNIQDLYLVLKLLEDRVLILIEVLKSKTSN